MLSFLEQHGVTNVCSILIVRVLKEFINNLYICLLKYVYLLHVNTILFYVRDFDTQGIWKVGAHQNQSSPDTKGLAL